MSLMYIVFFDADFGKTFESLETKFHENLERDDHGNLSAMSVVDNNNICEVSFSFSYWSNRAENPDKPQQLRNDANELKKTL